MFDKFWDEEGLDFGKAPEDPNAYSTGVIGGQNAVLVHMAYMGKVSAASSAAWVKASFTRIKLALVVGICGGTPFTSTGEEIILGDVVISEALIQYDFGRQHPTAFQRKDTLDDRPGSASLEVRALLSRLRTDRGRGRLQKKMVQYLSDPALPVKYAKYPGAKQDVLFESTYRHVHRSDAECAVSTEDGGICEAASIASCSQVGCDLTQCVTRERLSAFDSRLHPSSGSSAHSPLVHIGKMASGDIIMRSAEHRDIIARWDSVIAFEMEGIGVWDHFPSLVIKGVCDYSDSHKSKTWQVFAAGTAAACTKAFLTEWTSGIGPSQDETLPICPGKSFPYSPPSLLTPIPAGSSPSTPPSIPVPSGNVLPKRSVNTLFTDQEETLNTNRSANFYGSVFATYEASALQLEMSIEQSAKDALDMLFILCMLGASETTMPGTVELPLAVFEAAWEGARIAHANGGNSYYNRRKLTKWHTSLLPSLIRADSKEWNPDRIVEASNLLASLSLVVEHKLGNTTSVSMHPLAYRWAKERQETDAQSQAWLSTGALIALASCSTHLVWYLYEEQLRCHLHAWLEQRYIRAFPSEYQLEIALMIVEVGSRLHIMCNNVVVTNLLAFMFTTFNLDPLTPRPEWAFLYFLKARSLRRAGHKTEAISILEKIRKIDESTLPKDHPILLDTLERLGVAYHGDGRWDKAISLFKEVVRMREKSLKEDDRVLLGSRTSLARAYAKKGRRWKAIAILEDVVFRKQKLLPGEDPNHRYYEYGLAKTYFENRQFEKAMELMEKVARLDARLLRANHPRRVQNDEELEMFQRELNKRNKATGRKSQSEEAGLNSSMVKKGARFRDLLF